MASSWSIPDGDAVPIWPLQRSRAVAARGAYWILVQRCTAGRARLAPAATRHLATVWTTRLHPRAPDLERLSVQRQPELGHSQVSTMPIVDDIAGFARMSACAPRTLAVVGLSAPWHRPSYSAAKCMQRPRVQDFPVNPRYDEVLGPISAKLPYGAGANRTSSIAFASPRKFPPSPGERLPSAPPLLWMQLGISQRRNRAQRASAAGAQNVVICRCVKIEPARLLRRSSQLGRRRGQHVELRTAVFLRDGVRRRGLHPAVMRHKTAGR